MPNLVNPFNCKRPVVHQPKLDNHILSRVSSMSVDKETLMTYPVYEDIDTVKEIQACKDLCGLDYMKKLLASGQVSAEDLQDNSGDNFDLTKIPDNVHEAKAKANEINQQVGELAKAVGAEDGQSYNAREMESMITEAVKKAMQAQAAKAPAPEVKDNA